MAGSRRRDHTDGAAAAVLVDPAGDRDTVLITKRMDHSRDTHKIVPARCNPVIAPVTARRLGDHHRTLLREAGPTLHQLAQATTPQRRSPAARCAGRSGAHSAGRAATAVTSLRAWSSQPQALPELGAASATAISLELTAKALDGSDEPGRDADPGTHLICVHVAKPEYGCAHGP